MIRMPLKLKLGRTSGRYELSDDIYILTVLVGDTTIAQCTLTSLSTSEDVFRYLGEKLNLNQPEIFGLQYQMKATDTEKRMLRWVEPDKPIRKQLERWACRRGQKWAVNLAILHACANVFTLQDGVSRAVYYTLLKWEVLQSEKFAMDLDKSIILAAYQLQIECPDFKPTLQDLKMLNLLPQSICRSPNMINNDDIYVRILNKYEQLHTMQPAYVTLLYIVEIQQCDGYGEEAFPCKDGSSLEEVSLGYSLEWIFVRRPNGSTQKFRWEEVREIVANKRKMSIKYGDNLANSIFCFEDNEMARYVSTVLTWKWRHARTDAQQQRSARLSGVQNLQGCLPSFSQPGSFMRRSNTNMNAIRPSIELNSAAGTNYLGTTFLPSTPQMSSSARMDHQGSQSTVHSVQSCALRTSINPNPTLSVCCRSVSLSQIPPNVPAGFHQKLLPSVPAERISPPGPTIYYPPGLPTQPPPPLPHHPPPPLAVVQQQASNSSQDSDWLRNEQREVLKKMLTQKRRMNKIGSSPEINTLGKSVSGSGAKCKRHLLNSAAAAAAAGAPSNSSFLLARKIFTSTPNLHSARQQQQPVPPQTLIMAHTNGANKMATMLFPSPPVNHRLKPPFALPFPAAAIAGPYISPPAYHQYYGMNGTGVAIASGSNGSSTGATAPVGFYIPPHQVQSAAAALGKASATAALPSSGTAYFSRGQVIDENGQQQTIIYPVPAEAAATTFLGHHQQSSPSPPQQQHSSYPPHSHAFPSNSPPIHSNNNNIGGGGGTIIDDSRSSPKSNGTSSAHSEPTQLCAIQSISGSIAEQQQQQMTQPEFVEIEFSGIPAKSLSSDFSVAIRPHNLPRNRGSKIYPYNENRVKLSGTKSNPDGYINASEVHIPVGKQCRMRYVVSQAPIQKTIEDFWKMVWETGARLIVMLVNPHQINKDDTIPSYIPSQAKEKFTVGEYFLRLKNVSPPMQMQFQSTTMFTLSKQRQRRTIFHLYCADFAEPGVPSSMDTFIGLIDAVASVKQHIGVEWMDVGNNNNGTDGGIGNGTENGKNGVGGGKAGTDSAQLAGMPPGTNGAEQATTTRTTTAATSVSKSNSNASKGSSQSSNDILRERTQSVESSGWTTKNKKKKKLRFEQQQQQQQLNGHNNNSSSNGVKNNGKNAIEKKAERKLVEPLAIIQCTDGASESGMFLLADVIIKCIETNTPFEIAQLLRDVRYQRMCVVKNAQQYKFLYDLVSYYERKNRLV